MVFKNILLLIMVSIVAILFQNQLAGVLHGIIAVHQQIIKGLSAIFSSDGAGEIVQSVLALLLLPVVVGICFAIAHFFMKQQHFPHTLNVVWACWAVLLTAVLSQMGHISNQTAEEIQSAHKIAEAVKNSRMADQSGDKADQSGAQMAQQQGPDPLTDGAPNA